MLCYGLVRLSGALFVSNDEQFGRRGEASGKKKEEKST